MDWQESDYVDKYCPQWHGVIEYKLPDNTRIDCLTPVYAMEFDWCHKWAEGVGQSLFYAHMTNRKPVLVLICSDKEKHRFIKRAQLAAPELKIIIIEKRAG